MIKNPCVRGGAKASLNRISMTQHRRTQSGFTLLEVVLSISLSVILVSAITTAIYLNINVVQRQQVRIEQSQVARNVLMMMANDLRASIQYMPADVTGLDELAVSQEAIANVASGANMSETDLSQIDPTALAGAVGGGATDSGATDEPEAEAPSTASQNISSGQSEVLRPGLYGNSTEIMIDISRLPRLDQYSPVVLGTSGPVSLPTDIKTIAYFVNNEQLETDKFVINSGQTLPGGLYRRELDRAVAAFNLNVSGTLAAEGYTRLIASEIIAIEFRYFDGNDFQTSWDSDEMSAFPSAIEITIVVDPQRSLRASGQVAQLEEVQAYRSVVYLPVSEIVAEEESGGDP